MIQVHITDDHKMVVEGFTEIINKSKIAEVCGVSYKLNDCRRQIAIKMPDILLLDIEMPDGNGMDFFIEVKEKYPEMKVIALTTHDEYSTVKHLIDHNISGYILKTAYSEEIIDAIESVANGQTYLCSNTISILNNKREIPVRLTKRELELLGHLLNGETNKEAAIKMSLTVETIKSYRKNIKLKLNAQNAMEMGKIAYQEWKFFFDDEKEY